DAAAAAQHDGRSARLWTSLGVAALAVVLCCGGGIAAAVGLVVTETHALNEKGRAAVADYLDDVRAGRYRDAYEDLCPDLKRRESAQEFAARLADEPAIADYRLREVQLPGLELPVEVTYRDGDRDTLRFSLAQDRETGELEVCGVTR
ncbi:MAG TPA: hypothetical protein VNV66_16355, partial [Pilimelia sp.]|nr:hypothetical protein [Pilimelia sp.]